jgi:hypothetical protein
MKSGLVASSAGAPSIRTSPPLRARDSAQAAEAMQLHLARVSGHLNATDPAAGVTW